jgi:hypothetical protein
MPTTPPCASSAKSGGEAPLVQVGNAMAHLVRLCYTRARNRGSGRTSIAASAAHSNKRVASVARRGGSCPSVRSGVNSGASHPSRDSSSPPQRPSDAG